MLIVSFEDLEKRARLLQGLAQPNRLRLMRLLFDGPSSVGELAKRAGISTANTSQHLLKLRNLSLVQRSAKGQSKIYSVGRAAGANFISNAVLDIPNDFCR